VKDANRTATSVLPQGERLVALFGISHELLGEPRLKPFGVKVEYEDLARKRRKVKCTLDISQFVGLKSIRSADDELAEAMKKMAVEVAKWSHGDSSRLKVEVITTAEREKRDQEWIEQHYPPERGEAPAATDS
jgi:hypothetical protein